MIRFNCSAPTLSIGPLRLRIARSPQQALHRAVAPGTPGLRGYVGSLVALVLPVLLAFLELEPIWRPLAVLALLLVWCSS